MVSYSFESTTSLLQIMQLPAGSSGQYVKTSGTTVTWYTRVASDITTELAYTPVNKAGDTMTGALTMSGANIALGTNSLTTPNYIFKEFSTTAGVSQFFQNSVANIQTNIGIAPNGTSVVTQLDFFRTSDTVTNFELLRIGSDVQDASTFAIQTFNGGTGVLRPLAIYMKATKLLSFDTANTVTFYVNTLLSSNIIMQAASGVIAFSVVSTALTIGTLGSLISPLKSAVGVPTDAQGGNVDGAIVVSSGDSKIYARIGGLWKGVAIA